MAPSQAGAPLAVLYLAPFPWSKIMSATASPIVSDREWNAHILA